MADFAIVAPVPFIVTGVHGTYELPRMQDLNADQMIAISALEGLADLTVPEQTARIREFLYVLCPDLEAEPLTDSAVMRLFGALDEGSDLTEGES